MAICNAVAKRLPLRSAAVSLPKPMPSLPRGRRGLKPTPPSLAIEVPRRSPQRELHELRVLMKPHDWTRDAVRHRKAVDRDDPLGEQPWRDEDAATISKAAAAAAERLGLEVTVDREGEDVRLRVAFADATEPMARAVAACCSAAVPHLWLTFGRLAVYDGKFWRRERGVRFSLKPAPDVHLPREVRTLLTQSPSLLRKRRIG